MTENEALRETLSALRALCADMIRISADAEAGLAADREYFRGLAEEDDPQSP